MVFMNAIVEIDKAGRIVVPKKLRDDLHLVAGTRLRIERSGDRLTFEPEHAEPQLILKDGMLVVSGEPGTLTNEDVSEVIRQGYAERMERILEGSGLE
jgi:AbrB family looped-hinge helix DNA binding protein